MRHGNRTYGYVATIDLHPPTQREKNYVFLEKMRSQIQKGHLDVTRVLYLVDKIDREGFTVALRAVKTKDFLTAELAPIPWKALKEASSEILAKCKRVKSVYWDATPKPPATVEFE